MSVAPPSNFNAEEADNLEDVEKQFAVKVVQHMETYWKILERKPGSELRLTRYDDHIYETFKTDFPDFDPAAVINEEGMKSKQGKEQWRKFINQFEKGEYKIDDYNFGAMVRADAKTEYTQEGTVFVVRMQFYAIEIARNRAGLNDWIYEQAHAEENKP